MHVKNDGFLPFYFQPGEILTPAKEYSNDQFKDELNKMSQLSYDSGDFFAKTTAIKNKQSTPLSQPKAKKIKILYPKTLKKIDELGEKCIIVKCKAIDQDGSFQDGRCPEHYLLREKIRAGMKTRIHPTSIPPEVIKFLKERSKVSEDSK